MSKNVHEGIEPVWVGRPEFDDPHRYGSVYESIRQHGPTSKRKLVALCFECMETPKREPRDPRNEDDRPLRCEQCEYNHNRRMTIAKRAKG